MRSGAASPRLRIKSAVAGLISLAVLGGGTALIVFKGYEWYMNWRQSEDYIGDGGVEVVVTIPDGVSLTRIGDILQSKDVIRDSDTFIKVIRDREKDSGEPVILESGWYKMRLRWPAAAALDRMLDPESRVEVMVTVAEGKRWVEIKPDLAADSGFSEHDYEVAAAQPGVIDLPDYAGGQVEGYLFPDTYKVPPSAPGVLRQMAGQFKAVAEELGLVGRAAEMGFEPGDIVKVASIIEAEVSRADDRPMAARAIYNRLAQGMRLQTDSTLIYGLGLTGYLGITQAELDDESNPYNLYQHDGLPPTPINNPGRAALEAALNPAEGDWLYWVTVDLESGETLFGATGEEHEANVELLRAWCAEHPEYGC
ncbi:MAG: endolytic transglycosylase MltG [Propionibacteriaceae bacterium]|jgi:UPF0755 protein|nr:endolytic transglycosylase MltG [Propionibacteriaceae bacterium]